MPHLRSALLLAAVVSGGILLGYLGILQHVWAKDTYYICTATVAVAAWGFFVGFRNPQATLEWAEECMALGLFGTVLGITITLAHYAGGGREELFAMLQGIGVAVYTTLVGLVCSRILRKQAFFLWHERGE